MLKIFPTNGLFFYPTNSSLQANGTSFVELPYTLQNQPGLTDQSCHLQPVNFEDVSRVQLISNAAVNIRVYDSSDTLLQTYTPAIAGQIDGNDVYQQQIDWSALAVDTGSYITIENGSQYYKSLGLYQPFAKLLKLEYSNNLNSIAEGARFSNYMHVVYVPAVLRQQPPARTREVYQDSRGNLLNLQQTFKKAYLMEVAYSPAYLHEIVDRAIHSDTIKITSNQAGLSVSANYSLPDDELYEYEPVERSTLYTAQVLLVQDNTFERKFFTKRPDIDITVTATIE